MSTGSRAILATELSRLGYRPALDGLRAVAVLAVMLHHSGLLPGGWLGVDVFFVLSGFLITTLLLEEYHRTGDVSLRRFYLRRALRLLPSLLALLVVFGAVIIAMSEPALLTSILLRLMAVFLYVANLAMMNGFGLYPFAHTWSLAIEEQFYALWPLALLLLLRKVGNRIIVLLVVGGGIVGSIAWRSFLVHHHASLAWVYQGLDTRVDAILMGCALAMLTSWRLIPDSAPMVSGRRWAGAAGAVGLCLLFATARYPRDFLEHFASTLAALAATLLICQLLSPGSLLARLLEARPLVGIGRISYGLYLWHFPIFFALGVLIGKRTGFHPILLGLAWLITFAVCLASFKFLEQPALSLKSRLVERSLRSAVSHVPTDRSLDETPIMPDSLKGSAPLAS